MLIKIQNYHTKSDQPKTLKRVKSKANREFDSTCSPEARRRKGFRRCLRSCEERQATETKLNASNSKGHKTESSPLGYIPSAHRTSCKTMRESNLVCQLLISFQKMNEFEVKCEFRNAY